MTPLSTLAPLLFFVTHSHAPAQPLAESTTDEAQHTVVIAPGTQTALGAVRIAAGNIFEAEEARPGEPSRKRQTAELWIQVDGERKTHRRVVRGSAFDAGGRRFSVTSVEPRAVRLVTFRKGSP